LTSGNWFLGLPTTVLGLAAVLEIEKRPARTAAD